MVCCFYGLLEELWALGNSRGTRVAVVRIPYWVQQDCGYRHKNPPRDIPSITPRSALASATLGTCFSHSRQIFFSQSGEARGGTDTPTIQRAQNEASRGRTRGVPQMANRMQAANSCATTILDVPSMVSSGWLSARASCELANRTQ